MAKVSAGGEEVNARIVYWGIDGAGKRTSLAGVYQKLRPDHRGEMREVPTRFDPSITYTVLPIELGTIGGMHTRIEMIAVPGAPEHAPTRKQLLDQVDGIVFVVDCQRERVEENLACLEELAKALEDYGRSIDTVPMVVQYNKRDLSDAFATEELHRRLGLTDATVFEAVASETTGLLQALSTISKKVIRALRDPAHPLADKTPEPSPVSPGDPAVTAEENPVAATPLDPRQAIEDAMLAEAEHPARAAAEAQSQAAESLLRDQPWLHDPDELEVPRGARIGADLVIVSVGQAHRVDDRSVRVPLVLGDGDGETSTLMLTVRLDPILDGSGD